MKNIRNCGATRSRNGFLRVFVVTWHNLLQELKQHSATVSNVCIYAWVISAYVGHETFSYSIKLKKFRFITVPIEVLVFATIYKYVKANPSLNFIFAHILQKTAKFTRIDRLESTCQHKPPTLSLRWRILSPFCRSVWLFILCPPNLY